MKLAKNYLRFISATTLILANQSWAIAGGTTPLKLDREVRLIAQALQQNQSPEVLIPNPTIKIDGKPVQPTQPVPPPFLPRAVAPPVGDMAVSNIRNTSPNLIKLGFNAPLPKLVLREAPVREVLSLLARASGMNLVFTDANTEGINSTISLDLENEPIEDVFNWVLMISGLNAGKKGNTIFVGANLPFAARNVITRSIRMNQYPVIGAAQFLGSQGASVKVVDVEEKEEGGDTKITFETKEVFLEEAQGERLILRGLTVHGDEINNNIVLVGAPHLVEIATNFLTQLDVRRRQVAVNVKVVDVQLNQGYSFGSSFSFGINDTGVIQDGGVGVINFGTSNQNVDPREYRVDANGNLIPAFDEQLIIENINENGIEELIEDELEQINDSSLTSDLTRTLSQSLTDRISQTIENGGVVTRGELEESISQALADEISENLSQELNRNLTETITRDLTSRSFIENILELQGIPLGFPNSGRISPFSSTAENDNLGQNAEILPGRNFNVPQAFLAQIRANIDSGNAKILTDPTLVVQEGQIGTVELVENIVTSVNTQIDQLSGVRTTTPVLEPAGLTLSVAIQKIDDNGFVSLVANPEVSAPGETQLFDSGLGAINQITPLVERKVSSGLIRLRDGQTLILSGIIQDGERTVTSKVPILGDLPIIGSLFRSTFKDSTRSEVIVLLTPQILNDSEGYSGFGYNYRPSRETSDYLRDRGLTIPSNPY